MKSKRLLAAVVSCTVIFSSLLVGCGSTKTTSNNISKSTPDKEQYLNVVLLKEPNTLDPSKVNDLYGYQVDNQVFEGLTRVEKDDKGNDVVKPAGAEKWDISEDGLKWTFHLRDYEWSDGKKVTAKDFEYGIKRTLDPKTAAETELLYPIKNAEKYNSGKAKADEVGIKAIDDKTLEITLESPCAYFLKTTYFRVMYPQRQDIVEKYGEKYGTEVDKMIFCGPFKLKEWVHGNKIELEKNDKYWDKDSVKLSKATMKIVEDDGSAMQELYNGGIDVARVNSGEWREKFDKAGKYDVEKVKGTFVKYEVFNHKNKLFSNAKVRKAFALAIDREDAGKVAFKTMGPAYGWVPTAVQIGDKNYREVAGEEPLKKLKEENKDPKKLLIEGLKELGMDPDPSKLTINYLQGMKGKGSKEVPEYFQAQYKKVLDVNMKIEALEWPVFMKKIKNSDFEISSLGWSLDYDDPMGSLGMWVKSSSNQIPNNYSNPKYDELVKKAAALSPKKNDERLELFKQAENVLLYEDAAVAPIADGNKDFYKHKYVKKIIIPSFGSELDLKYVYTEGRESK
ncbi:bacterial extracellular solute-binding s, 5 Middle family protein [Clostridium sporogenes]|uniref:Bacterial extracellular solute-binding s, 5 Middle family protein n=1 Tax=Clostridium sporogenes TaxID=1509 RepID=A0A1L3NF91_CLOSG|nr:peptide ABC transporter substrate-binding protein [Clostridium sporogenes]APH14774.1 bacterial extracellular solute-binding s, 5 Middle family protein [Clostridium sporogenes]